MIGLSADKPGDIPSITSVEAFHLGGAENIPGFYSRGVARSAHLESLGMCSYWLASAHYILGIPSVPDFLKLQLHASACGAGGVIGGPEEQQSFSSAFSPDALRASTGIGLVAALPGTGRISLTMSKVLASRIEDRMTNFIQIGFATSFD